MEIVITQPVTESKSVKLSGQALGFPAIDLLTLAVGSAPVPATSVLGLYCTLCNLDSIAWKLKLRQSVSPGIYLLLLNHKVCKNEAQYD